jgi:hypothetical protein
MRSLQRRFQIAVDEQSNRSSFFNFIDAIRNQGFSTKTIRFWFQRLVEPDDYCSSDRGKLFKHFYRITRKGKCAEEGMFEV